MRISTAESYCQKSRDTGESCQNCFSAEFSLLLADSFFELPEWYFFVLERFYFCASRIFSFKWKYIFLYLWSKMYLLERHFSSLIKLNTLVVNYVLLLQITLSLFVNHWLWIKHSFCVCEVLALIWLHTNALVISVITGHKAVWSSKSLFTSH